MRVAILILVLFSVMALPRAESTWHVASDVAESVSDDKPGAIALRNLVHDGEGFLTNTSSDGFLMLGNVDLPRSQACYVLLDMEFKDPMFRPGLFELFWAIDPRAFSEAQKTRFLISHEDSVGANTFVLPLCKLYRFSGNLNSPNFQRNIVGIRLDYPMNRTISLKINSMTLMDGGEYREFLNKTDAPPIRLEPFENLPGKAFTSFDTIVPKVYFGIENGLKRLLADVPFLVVWLFIIFVFLGLIVRSFSWHRSGE